MAYISHKVSWLAARSFAYKTNKLTKFAALETSVRQCLQFQYKELFTSLQVELFCRYRRQMMSEIEVLVAVSGDEICRSVFPKVTPLRYLKM